MNKQQRDRIKLDGYRERTGRKKLADSPYANKPTMLNEHDAWCIGWHEADKSLRSKRR